MDFRDSPDDAQFRSTVRDVLDAAIVEIRPEPAVAADRLARFRRFQNLVYRAGYAGLSWPKEYGGAGSTLTQQAIFLEEYDKAGAPDRLNRIGEFLAGPTIINLGTDEQKKRFLKPILTGEDIWCQLFSEPGAGSDLAGLDTRAVRDGDGWRISGQKVWTSRAHLASYGLLLARTGGPRHKGLTYFLMPMASDAVTIRPLRNISGDDSFNEVFFDEAWISDDLRVGEENDGWRVAMATLSYERVALAIGRINVQRVIADLMRELQSESADRWSPTEMAELRRKIAGLYARAQVSRINGLRALASMEKGVPGPEGSIGKLFLGPLTQDIADLACSMKGFDAQLTHDDRLDPWMRLAYQARGSLIAGGTTFIQRNIIAERILKMPR